jgi:hypothetical protein
LKITYRVDFPHQNVGRYLMETDEFQEIGEDFFEIDVGIAVAVLLGPHKRSLADWKDILSSSFPLQKQSDQELASFT